ncbi:cyclin-dependent kinase inhibitor 1C-like [Ostrinia furnacalis]|uniref:cyclin-dependent kinase inhibitor 1C-like n=1 Tax=Ostrinia furnacalis TaxID=93504 RepID=UPI0010391D0F|nr:cyclin-dependent kinase inhibitor 1C-like [Ostrinia furnacalis]
MRADNTSVVTLMLDPPGPPRATVLRSRTQKPAALPAPAPAPAVARPADDKPVPQNGLTIMTRYSDAERPAPDPAPAPPARPPAPADAPATYGDPAESRFVARALGRSRVVNTLGHVYDEIVRPPDPGPPATALPDPAGAALA